MAVQQAAGRDIRRCAFTWDGVPIDLTGVDGVPQGRFVNPEALTSQVANDGSVVYGRTNDNRYQLTIQANDMSTAYRRLGEAYDAQHPAGEPASALTLKQAIWVDNNNGTKVSGNAVIRTRPDMDFGKQATDRAWVIEWPNPIVNHAPNLGAQ